MRMRCSLVFAVASLVWSQAAYAALISTSREVMVNTITGGAQQNPAVAVGADGRFLVVWQDNRFDNQGVHVRARMLAADLEPVGDDFQVDFSNESWNLDPDVATLADGTFVVVWQQGIGGGAILARRISAEGSLLGEEFRIDVEKSVGSDTPVLGAPSVAAAADGGFVVAWPGGVRKASTSMLYTGVHVRAFTAAGEPKSEDRVIQAEYLNVATNVDLRASSEGFVLAWAAGSGFGAPAARALRLDPDAVPVGDQLIDLGGSDPRVATAESGRSYVISTTVGGAQAPWDVNVFGRTFDSSVLGEPFVLTERARRDPSDFLGLEIATTTVESGDLVVAWVDGNSDAPGDGSDSGVFADVFDVRGYAKSDPRRVNVTTANGQLDPELERVGDSGIVVVWESDLDPDTGGDSGEVYARLFQVADAQCGDGTEDGEVTATDALFALGAAVGTTNCSRCLCDADGSGSTSATDALALLQASVGMGVELACPACPTGNGIGVDLVVDSQCHSAHVEIPTSALPAGGIDCAVDPYVKALPCASNMTLGPDGLSIDVRYTSSAIEDCWVAATTLFSCRADAAVLKTMAESAVVTCGCGCEEECPAPRVCVSDGTGSTCSPTANLSRSSVSRAAARSVGALESHTTVSNTESISAASSVSTTSFSCGTCCNTPVVGNIELVDDVKVTELRVRLQGDVDSTCLYCEAWGSEIVDRDDGTVEFCIFRPEGIQGPTVLSPCFGNVGSITPGPAEVLRARGENFETIEPPAVNNDF